MYSLNQLKEELSKRYNQNVDLDILESCLHIWNIEPVSNNDQNKEYFDEITLKKLYRGFKLKQEGYCESVIPKILNKLSFKPKCECNKEISPEEKVIQKVEEAIKQKELEQKSVEESKQKDLSTQSNTSKTVKKVTKTQQENKTSVSKVEEKNKEVKGNINIDNEKQNTTNNKLVDVLSKNISEKVSLEILNYLQQGEFLEDLIKVSALKRDNEILSKQVEELILVNGDLENKIFALELELNNYKKLWKNLYFKFN